MGLNHHSDSSEKSLDSGHRSARDITSEFNTECSSRVEFIVCVHFVSVILSSFLVTWEVWLMMTSWCITDYISCDLLDFIVLFEILVYLIKILHDIVELEWSIIMLIIIPVLHLVSSCLWQGN